MGYWHDEWQRAYSRVYDRSLSQILLRFFCGAAIIAASFYSGYYISDKFQIDPTLIGFIEIGITIATLREMLKNDGSIHDLFVYFGNRILKKKVVAYHAEIKLLQSRVSELEVKNLELSNERTTILERIENTGDKDREDAPARGVSSYQKLLLFYIRKCKDDCYDSGWASKTAKAMGLQGLDLSDKTLRAIRDKLLEFEKARKDKA